MQSEDNVAFVTITSPQHNDTVSHYVNIECKSTFNLKFDRVELWVDEKATNIIDYSKPYVLRWNTINYKKGSAHIIKVRSYDFLDFEKDSDPITLYVDNSDYIVPDIINISSVNYDINEMTIKWNKARNSDFIKYELYHAEADSLNKNIITTKTVRNDTIHILTNFDPTVDNYFWVSVTDTLGYTTLSNSFHIKDAPPQMSHLNNILFRNVSFYLSWKSNTDSDFSEYLLYESDYPDMSNQTLVQSFNTKTDTHYVIPGILNDTRKYYRIDVKDYWNLVSEGNIQCGSSFLKIVYATETHTDDYDICVMDIDGNNKTVIVDTFSFSHPTFSPNGSDIAYRYRSLIGNCRVDGYGQRFLTGHNYGHKFCSGPAYSNDGAKIVYSLFYFNFDGYIRMVNNDGTDNILIKAYPDTMLHTSFAPDDTKILFSQKSSNTRSDVRLINVDRTVDVNLTNGVGYNISPSFSPDGNRILFISDRDGDKDIYTIAPDGTNLIQLTNNVLEEIWCCYSPDQSKILFVVNEDDQNSHDLYIMDADGSNVLRLTADPGKDDYASFSNDGSKLLYRSQRDGNDEIYIMNLDGTRKTNLTNNPASDLYPRFQPIRP